MTDFSDFTAELKEWANRDDWSDVLVASFVRSAEEKLNSELRIDRMIKRAQDTVTCSCANLPDDWLEADLVLMAAGTPNGFAPIRYWPRDEFFKLTDRVSFGKYTIEGRTIYFGGSVDTTEGKTFEMSYYAEVPVFSDTITSWVYTKFPSLYRYAALMHADLHAVGEEDKAGGLKQLAEDMIQKLNADHFKARASGSRLARGHRRSFG